MADLTAIDDDPSGGFFESTRDLLLVESPEGRFVKTNKSLTQLLGYSGTGLYRTAIFDLVSPNDRPAVSDALETLEKGAQAVEFECLCCVADGSYVVLHWSVSKHAATGVRYWVGRNITAHKRTEALLAGQAKAIDASHAVIEFRLDGTIIVANERFLALMEYRGEDIIGRHHRILVQPEYAATQEYSKFWEALNRGEFQSGEFQRFTRSGNAVWIQATYTPILGLDGKPEKVVKFATNITERIVAERQLKTLNDTLSRNLEVSRQRDADNSILFEVTAFLQASLTEDEVRDLVGRYINQLSGKAMAAALYLFAGEDGERRAATWHSDELVPTIGRTECWALRRGMIHTRVAGATRPMCKHLSGRIPSEAPSTCVPIFADGVVGVLTAYWAPPGLGDLQAIEPERAQSMLLMLAARVGSALEAIRLRSRLEEESIRDGLTGLYNRRYLDDALRRELLRARRLQLPVSAVMFDIDRFKVLNDTHGHEIGDTALRAVAQTISNAMRQGDIVCRYGGEEFAVLLVGESQEMAVKKAEAIRAAVERLDIGGWGEGAIKLTVSAGVSEAGLLPLGGVSLLQRADRALYCAKNDGRNLVRAMPNDDPAASLEAMHEKLSTVPAAEGIAHPTPDFAKLGRLS
jgi:diguanylate cyclase (GGDEF)-like protein/PAS domain S-box-containing protein